MTQQYIEPTRQGRIGLLLVGLVAIGIGLALFHFGPTFFQPPSSLSACEDIGHYRDMMQKASLFLLIPGLWLCFYASRILSSGQSPAPGAWVLHRAAVKTGPQVTRAGYLLLALGIAVAVSPVYFWSDLSQFEKEKVSLFCTGT